MAVELSGGRFRFIFDQLRPRNEAPQVPVPDNASSVLVLEGTPVRKAAADGVAVERELAKLEMPSIDLKQVVQQLTNTTDHKQGTLLLLGVQEHF